MAVEIPGVALSPAVIRSVSQGRFYGGKGYGPNQMSAPTAPTQFMLSVIGHLGWTKIVTIRWLTWSYVKNYTFEHLAEITSEYISRKYLGLDDLHSWCCLVKFSCFFSFLPCITLFVVFSSTIIW